MIFIIHVLTITHSIHNQNCSNFLHMPTFTKITVTKFSSLSPAKATAERRLPINGQKSLHCQTRTNQSRFTNLIFLKLSVILDRRIQYHGDSRTQLLRPEGRY